LAAALAHQIRTPLAAALMYLRLVEQEVGEQVSPPLREGLTSVCAEISKLDRLLGNLMDMHRLGHPVIRPTLVDGARVIGDAVSRALPEPAGAKVSVEIGACDLTDWWDPNALEQIVQTLISNAFKYGQGRPIAVTVDRVDACLRLRVRDDGSGIPAAAHTRIFRGPPVAPKARAPGLGLGLWLVGRLAEAHGGSASVESRDGAGTTFTVTLNPQRPPATIIGPPADQPTGPLADRP
jgi:signal transduction histidine kinase